MRSPVSSGSTESCCSFSRMIVSNLFLIYSRNLFSSLTISERKFTIHLIPFYSHLAPYYYPFNASTYHPSEWSCDSNIKPGSILDSKESPNSTIPNHSIPTLSQLPSSSTSTPIPNLAASNPPPPSSSNSSISAGSFTSSWYPPSF